MPLLDLYGNPVSVGDAVTITGTIDSLADDQDNINYVNCVVLLDQPMPPSGAQTRLPCNTTQLIDNTDQPATGPPEGGPTLVPTGLTTNANKVNNATFQVVSAGNTTPWTANPDSAWLTVSQPSSPVTGDGTVKYSVANNTDVARDGAITIDPLGLAFTIHQDSGLVAAEPAAADAETHHEQRERHHKSSRGAQGVHKRAAAGQPGVTWRRQATAT